MEKGRLGVVRDSMHINQLLQKSELGKNRTRCYSLPGSEFIYGRRNVVRDGGVPEAIGHWDSAETKVYPRKKVRDFMALDLGALQAGLIKPVEVQHYRKTHDIQRWAYKEPPKYRPIRLPPDMTFGITTRPSTPIYDLLENKYQDIWLQQQRLAEEARHTERKEKLRLGRGYETRSTMIRKYQPPMEPPPLWHLPRFDKVGPHLDTFPTAKARQKAFSARQSDAVARSGQHGMGVYTSG